MEKEIDSDAHYFKYENMLNERAWSFYKTTGLPFTDLKAETDFAFVIAQNKYRKDMKVQFGTFLYIVTTTTLMNYISQQKVFNEKYTSEEPSEDLFDMSCSAFQDSSVKSMLKNLSEEAQTVCGILFNCPDELFGLAQSSAPLKVRKALRTTLKKLGWDMDKIKDAEYEIKTALQTI